MESRTQGARDSRPHTRRRKILLSLAVVGITAAAASFGTYSAYTATTPNTGNSLSSGTVAVGQHAGASTLYTGTNRKPGDTVTGCVRVRYTGTLVASALKLYVSSGVTNGSDFNLRVERGSGLTTLDNTMSCAGFTASSTPYDGTLGAFPTTYGTGIDGKASAATWATNDSVDYRFTITVNDDPTPNARTSATSTGSHGFTWEARN